MHLFFFSMLSLISATQTQFSLTSSNAPASIILAKKIPSIKCLNLYVNGIE